MHHAEQLLVRSVFMVALGMFALGAFITITSENKTFVATESQNTTDTPSQAVASAIDSKAPKLLATATDSFVNGDLTVVTMYVIIENTTSSTIDFTPATDLYIAVDGKILPLDETIEIDTGPLKTGELRSGYVSINIPNNNHRSMSLNFQPRNSTATVSADIMY